MDRRNQLKGNKKVSQSLSYKSTEVILTVIHFLAPFVLAIIGETRSPFTSQGNQFRD
jgi:hypothetical protein